MTNFMKRAAVAALLIALFVSSSFVRFQVALSLVICLGALLAWREALPLKEYGWAILFLVVAFIFNPFFLLRLPDSYVIIVNLLCLSLFVSSIVHYKQNLVLPVAAKFRN